MTKEESDFTIGQKIQTLWKKANNYIINVADESEKYFQEVHNDDSVSKIKKALITGPHLIASKLMKKGAKIANEVNKDIAPVIDAGLMFVPPQYSIPLQLGNRLYNHYAGIKNYYKGRYYEPNYGKYHFVYKYWKNRAYWNKTRYRGLVSYWKRKYFGSKMKKKRLQRWSYKEWLKTDPRKRPNAWDMYNYDWTPIEKKRFARMWEFRKGWWGPPYVAYRKLGKGYKRQSNIDEYYAPKAFWLSRENYARQKWYSDHNQGRYKRKRLSGYKRRQRKRGWNT